MRELFLLISFYHLTNLDPVSKDGVHVKSETNSDYLIAALCCMSTKVEVVATFYYKD